MTIHYDDCSVASYNDEPPDPHDILITCAIISFVFFLLTYSGC
jgi:hypothetical protein